MEPLRLIGYWRSDQDPQWPDPAEWIDASWDPRERNIVGQYLREGAIPWAGAGFSPCRICGKPNGSFERTDFVLLWPEGLAHYVLDHNVRLPQEVVALIMQRLDALESVSVDRTWWRSVTGL